LRGDGDQVREVTVRLGARVPLDKRDDGFLTHTAGVGEKRDARIRGYPEPIRQRETALRLRLEG
jgi:hypothetical protein